MKSQLKNEQGIFVSPPPPWDLNHGLLEPKASILPIRYSDHKQTSLWSRSCITQILLHVLSVTFTNFISGAAPFLYVQFHLINFHNCKLLQCNNPHFLFFSEIGFLVLTTAQSTISSLISLWQFQYSLLWQFQLIGKLYYMVLNKTTLYTPS